MNFVAGADGCRTGWVAALLDEDGTFRPLQVCATFADLLTVTDRADLLLVDIPIGLAGARECDRLARRALGSGRGSSVFPVPVRAAIHAPDYPTACELNRQATGRKLSRQAWGIVPKIAQVDLVMRAAPSLQARVHECHPEVCFAALNGGAPIAASKKTPKGLAERLDVLGCYTRAPGEALAEVRSRYRRADVADDDLVDAMVTAVTARVALQTGLRSLPPAPPVDAFGLRMEIVFAGALGEVQR